MVDIIKKSMFNIQQWITKDNQDIRLLMQAHDELVFEIKDSLVDFASQQIDQLMNQVVNLSIP